MPPLPGATFGRCPNRTATRDRLVYIAKITEDISWTDLGKRFGLSRTGAHRAFKREDARKLLESQDAELIRMQLKARQTAMLQLVATESLAAWMKSKERRTEVKRVTKPGAMRTNAEGEREREPDLVETETVVKETCGDTKYLQQFVATCAEIRKIWGADAPTAHHLTQDVTVSLDDMTDPELAQECVQAGISIPPALAERAGISYGTDPTTN